MTLFDVYSYLPIRFATAVMSGIVREAECRVEDGVERFYHHKTRTRWEHPGSFPAFPKACAYA